MTRRASTTGLQKILKPLGIITQPNKFGVVPAGALKTADFCYLRNAATIEPSSGWSNVSDLLFGSPIFVCAIGTQALCIFNNTGTWSYAWANLSTLLSHDNNTLLDTSGNQYSVDATGRTGFTRSRERTLFACQRGVLIWDYSNPANTSQSKPRPAGLLAPSFWFATTDFTSITGGGALSTLTACHMTAIIRRKYADGYEMISAPAPASHVYNPTTGNANVQWGVNFAGSFALAGDVIELYRTRSQSFGHNVGTNTGSEYYLSATYTLNSTDVSNGFTPLQIDTAPDANLGQALYTNASVETAQGMALLPNTCKCMATFKGYTFYFNRLEGAQFKFRIPVYWGGVPTGLTGGTFLREKGIGGRIVTCTITVGSPTVTAVSTTDMIGIQVGQRIDLSGGSQFPSTAVVISKTASTITFSQNATSGAGAGQTIVVSDVLEIDGLAYLMSSPDTLFISGIQPSQYQIILLDRVYPVIAGTALNVSSNVATVPAADVVIRRPFLFGTSAQPIAIRATNGNNYVPALPRIENSDSARSYTETSVPNGIAWSEQNQPENCPPLNTAFCGSGELYAAFSTRDAIWIFASDGLWRLSGTGGSAGAGFDWRIDPVDSTLSLAGPQAGCVLRDTVYAYTNRGLVSVDSAGTVKELTNGRLKDVLPGPPWSTPTYNAGNAIYLIADETNYEIVMREPLAAGGRVWIYNTNTDAFTQDIPNTFTTHGDYSSFLQSIVISDNTSSGRLIAPLSTTRPAATVTFQPIYGKDPFIKRHWQRADVVLDTGSSVNVQLAFNGGSLLTARTATPLGDSTHARTSFMVPRNAPAVSNSLAIRIVIASATVQTKFLGLAVHFEDIGSQRKNR